jgi:anti-sigma B factor antagonist
MITKQTLGDDRLIINPGKALDSNNAPEMSQEIADAYQAGYKFIIVNMCDLEFLASAGVGSILGNVEMLRQDGGEIIMCNVPEKILNVFEVLDLTSYLTIVGDEQEANELCVGKA